MSVFLNYCKNSQIFISITAFNVKSKFKLNLVNKLISNKSL